MLSDYLSVKNASGVGAKAFIASEDIVTKGILSSAGSKMLGNFIPPFTASAVNKLEDAGYAVRRNPPAPEFCCDTGKTYSKKQLCPWGNQLFTCSTRLS